MNLNQLYYFVTLAHMEHYTRASKVLLITQPSLSHAISSLEQELGTYLFEKQGRNVILTKYGRIFLAYAEEALGILDAGIKKTKSMTSEQSGRIDIGYIFTQGSEFVPEVVKGFLDANPEKQIEFHFSNGVTGDVIKGIKEERYDVGFCSRVEGEEDLCFTPISQEELVAVVPLDHPLAEKEDVTLVEIAGYPQIFFSEKSGLRKVIDKMFRDIGIKPKIVYTVDEDSALAGLAAKGLGIGIVPNVSTVKGLKVMLLPIRDLKFCRYIYMVTMKNKYQSPIVRQFEKYLQEKYEVKIEDEGEHIC